MILAFSSTTSGLFSLFNSSQASQNSIFSSEYSHRRKSLKTFRPAGLRISLSKDLPQLLISSKEGGGSPSQFKRSELLEFLLGPFSSFPFPGVELKSRRILKSTIHDRWRSWSCVKNVCFLVKGVRWSMTRCVNTYRNVINHPNKINTASHLSIYPR
jgi:hypothetical protein